MSDTNLYRTILELKRIIKMFLPKKLRTFLWKIPLVIKINHKLFSEDYYYCIALSGESCYNICINSDMTVTCNCQDYDGSGIIGDLNRNTFEDIFQGTAAQRFRKKLSQGHLPTSVCHRCVELRRVNWIEARRHVRKYTLPLGGIMVENTSPCNLKCLTCPRDYIKKLRKQRSMSLDDIERVAKIIMRLQIRRICFHNAGEPFLSDKVFEELTILRRYNPHLEIFCSTNGLLIDSEKKREAALLMNHLFISIDGPSQEIVEKYQVGGNFDKAYKNVRDIVILRNSRKAAGPVIEWKYVVFNWNDSDAHINKAIGLAQEAGVDILSFMLGDGTPSQISQRYLHDPFFQQLGVPSWKGRELDFRKN